MLARASASIPSAPALSKPASPFPARGRLRPSRTFDHSGRPAGIQAYWQGSMDRRLPGGPHGTKIELINHGDWAVEIGEYTATLARGQRANNRKGASSR